MQQAATGCVDTMPRRRVCSAVRHTRKEPHQTKASESRFAPVDSASVCVATHGSKPIAGAGEAIRSAP